MPVFEGHSTYLAFAIMILFLWAIPWKAMALWKSARKGQVAWFVFFVLVNTVGIMEIIYLKIISRDQKTEKSDALEQDAPKEDKQAHLSVYQSPQIDSDEYTEEEKALDEGRTLEEDARELTSVLDPASNPRILRMQERMEQEVGGQEQGEEIDLEEKKN